MKFFQRASDGGKDSGVTGFFFVEIKPMFSVVLLRLRNGTREAFHSHAFNALTWWLTGHVLEHRMCLTNPEEIAVKEYRPSFKPKYTPRENHHKVESIGVSWALSFRGPWVDKWVEYRNGSRVVLTHGRKVVSE